MKFECLKCGRCCKDEKTIVTLTHRDLIRLAEAIEMDEKELVKHVLVFYQVNEDTEAFLAFPSIETYRGKAIMGLRKRKDGSCIFLEENTCSVYPSRPMTCRTFPFTFSVQDGWLKYGVATRAKDICPGIGKGMEIDENQLAEIGWKAVTELKEYFRIAALWKRAVRSGVPAIPELLIKLILQSGGKEEVAIKR
ncbi:MAG: YkgJ family cysteine cluster protein [Candidatus Jordarchaeales archaeon]|nr:YkgJ family cysteine cluster protein [Candidatus Jordarchaeia archaeon]